MLRLPRAELDAIYAHARKGSPQEICGLLAGTRDGQTRTVTHAMPIRNSHPRPIGEYQLDPQEQLRTTLHVEDDLKLEVIGFYHSHPAGPARLSATDAARASWPGVSYFLVHLAPGEGHLSAEWDGERFAAEEVAIT